MLFLIVAENYLMCLYKRNLIMKESLSLFLILFFSTLSVLSQAAGQMNDEMDFCYKPSKPLFFSTSEYKNHYAEDVKEYQRCRQGFLDMQARVASMKKASEKNARLIHENYIIRNY